MIIAIGADHGGYDLKEVIKEFLVEKGIEVIDVGCDNKNSCDYPIFAKQVATKVIEGKCQYGIVVCTTGVGMSIAANKIKGIRCALCTDLYTAKMTREHNNSNVLALGAGVVGNNLAIEIVDTFISTEFSIEEKHARRVRGIKELETN